MVALWRKAFISSSNKCADLYRISRLSIPQHHIDIVRSLLSVDHRWTVSDLSTELDLSSQT
ncbi:hypothetical protein NPIL_650231, partial [Nephila pilipes]